MGKKIEISFDVSAIQELFDDGRSPLIAKRKAQELLNEVKDQAEEIITLEGAKVIRELIIRKMRT